MSGGDFITLQRKSLDSWLWDMPAGQTKVAITLLMMANWKEGQTFSSGTLVKVQRGQVMTSLESIAARARVSIRTVRTALKNLEMAGFLTSKATNKFRILTIHNYDRHQSRQEPGRQAERQAPDKRPTSNRQATDNDRTREQGNKGIREQVGGRCRATKIPSSWEPTSKHLEMARAHGLDLNVEASTFRDHALSKGRTLVNWDAGFSNWLRKAAQFRDERKPSSNPVPRKQEWL